MRTTSTIALLFLTTLLATSVHAQKNNPGSNGAANGKPFQHLQEQIDAINAELDLLAAGNADAIAAIEASILDLQQQAAALQSQIDDNEGDIDSLDNELNLLQAEIALKQDVLDGSCAEGSSLRVIHPDGTVICEFDDVGSTGYLSVLDVVTPLYPVAPIGGVYHLTYGYPTSTTMTATCPSGYIAIGGGAELWLQGWGLENQAIITETRPQGLNSWRATAEMSPSADPAAINGIAAHARCVIQN